MSTLQKPTSTTKPKAIDPETVTISGYAVDQVYGPEQVQAIDPSKRNPPHTTLVRRFSF